MLNLDFILQNALKEDLGDGDHTTLATVPENVTGQAHLIIKDYGILAGISVIQRLYQLFDPSLKLNIFLNDGAEIKPNDIAFTVSGKARSILQTERLALNILQRMSGIATSTRKFVDKIKDTNAIILDTRKTSPCLRLLEKMAVKIGGGQNHRFGLYDMILIKDNHIDFAGGIKPAITNTVNYLKKHNLNLKIEIEVRNFNELEQVLQTGNIHRIMLDNFTPEQVKKAVQIINHKYETEASGGITLENIRNYALTGVDFISVGALTHQIHSLDMSLKKQF